MNAIGENGPLLIGTAGALALVALSAVGWSPLMRPLQLAALPQRLQWQLALLLAFSTFGAILWDRLVFRLLDPDTYKVSAAEPIVVGSPLPVLRRAWPAARTLLVWLGIGVILLSGNPLLWLVSWQL